VTTLDIRAALVSADGNLKAILLQCIQDSGLPVDIDIEIATPSHLIDSEHLERLRSSEPQVVLLDMTDDPQRAVRTAAAIASGNPGAALVGVGPELEASCLLDAMRAGLVEYVPRPVEAGVVRDALERVMRKRGLDAGALRQSLRAGTNPGTGTCGAIQGVGAPLCPGRRAPAAHRALRARRRHRAIERAKDRLPTQDRLTLGGRSR